MAGFLRRAIRFLPKWIVRWFQHITRALVRYLLPLMYKAFRTSRSFLGHKMQPTFRRFRFLKPYIGPLIPFILKIYQISRYVVERLFSLLTSDHKELATIANAKPRGLENLGNTCYFNSVMQPLCHTDSLKESLRESQITGQLTESFLDFYTDMLSGESGPFSPHALHHIFGRESSRFDNRRQHDSHECLRHFLENIRKEEKRQLEKKGPVTSEKKLTVVDRVFGGHLMTVYVCSTCQVPYHVCEPCLDVSLPICFEKRKEGRKQGSNKKTGEDETRKTKEDEDENSELIEKKDIEEEKDEEEEEEEGDEEEEGEEEEEKAEGKQKEEDQTEKETIELGDNEEEKERKQHKEDENNENEVMEKENEEEQDEEYSGKDEGDEKAIRHQKQDKMKEEHKVKEEHTEEKEKDEALKQRNITDNIPDEEEKHARDEKHEKEKLEGDEVIRKKEENKGKRNKNSGKRLGKLGAVKEQSSSNDDWKVQQKPVEGNPNTQQKLNLKLNIRKEKSSTEPEVRASVKSQGLSDEGQTSGRTLDASEDEELFDAIARYKSTVSLLMKPLRSTCSNPQLSSIDSNPKSVEDCLMYFTRKEHINKEYLCNDCYGKHLENGGTDVLLTSATKQTMIFNPPAILTLHLKRFELKPGGSVKRTDMITYGELLDIAPYCSSMCLRNDPPCQNIWYSLYAVVVHSGSLESGHYKAYMKVQGNEQLGTKRFLQMEYFDRDVTNEGLIEMAMKKQRKSPAASSTDPVWYCANDSSISESSLSEVLNQEAYLLFYERLN